MTGKGSRVEQAVRQAEAAVAIGATRVGDVSAAEFNASQAAINELMQLVAKQDAELTALKGRRCDGCANWRRWANDSQHGDCTLLSAGHNEIDTDAAFFCAEWDGESR